MLITEIEIEDRSDCIKTGHENGWNILYVGIKLFNFGNFFFFSVCGRVVVGGPKTQSTIVFATLPSHLVEEKKVESLSLPFSEKTCSTF